MFRTSSELPSARPLLALAALGALAALTGCGSLPTSPVTAQARLESGAQATAAAPVVSPLDPGDTKSTDLGADHFVPPIADDVLTTFTATGASAGAVTSKTATFGPGGGKLVNGGWRLTVPAGALTANARFTLAVGGARGAACEVQVDPVPTREMAWGLSVDTHRQRTSDRIADWLLLWYDRPSRTWSPIDGSGPDRRDRTVSGVIEGPGIYGVGTPDGKAAW